MNRARARAREAAWVRYERRWPSLRTLTGRAGTTWVCRAHRNSLAAARAHARAVSRLRAVNWAGRR